MYGKIIASLKVALSEAETVAASGGDKWTDEIKEVLEGVQRSASAADYDARFEKLIRKYIPQNARYFFSFPDGGQYPSEIIIEKGYCVSRYNFDAKNAEQSIKKAAKQWQFENMLLSGNG